MHYHQVAPRPVRRIQRVPIGDNQIYPTTEAAMAPDGQGQHEVLQYRTGGMQAGSPTATDQKNAMGQFNQRKGVSSWSALSIGPFHETEMYPGPHAERRRICTGDVIRSAFWPFFGPGTREVRRSAGIADAPRRKGSRDFLHQAWSGQTATRLAPTGARNSLGTAFWTRQRPCCVLRRNGRNALLKMRLDMNVEL